MSLLKDKIARVDMGKILADNDAMLAQNTGIPGSELPKPLTRSGRSAVGLHAELVYRDELIAKENESLKATVAKFMDSEPTKRLDPKTIRASKWANRAESSFTSNEFEALKLEIESADGNVQPIKVRPLLGSTGEYEIVFGHRRHRACLELGLPVFTLIENVSDTELFAQMDRENRQRADLRPYEQGVMYARALDEGLFPSMRKMANELGVDVGNASKVISLARLPTHVLTAFLDVMEIQQNWASVLTGAIQKDPDVVLLRAKEVVAMTPRPAANAVFKFLIGATLPEEAQEKFVIKGSGIKRADINFNAKKGVFEISLTGLDVGKLEELKKAITPLLE